MLTPIELEAYIAETHRLKAWQESDPDAAFGHFRVAEELGFSPVANSHQVRHLQILGCDYRGPRVSTGCACQNACFQGNNGGRVTYGDCLRCIGVKPLRPC